MLYVENNRSEGDSGQRTNVRGANSDNHVYQAT